MKTAFEIVAVALEQIINGESLPSFRSVEFTDLLDATRSIAASRPGGGYQQAEYAQIGNRALQLLLLRLMSSMDAERCLAIMRDNEKPLC